MRFLDMDLSYLQGHGVPPFPLGGDEGHLAIDGASIFYRAFGAGPVVVLLHGGMGNCSNFSYQASDLVAAGYRAVLIDSRGQGRSSRDGRPLSYRQMAIDTLAVLDHLGIERAAVVGWSDGAVTGTEMARMAPGRVAGVFFFACYVDSSGTLPFEFTPIIGRILDRNRTDYAAMSPTPGDFDAVFALVGEMQRTQPEYSAADIAAIAVPVTVVLGDGDEFIRREHLQYLARTLPKGSFRLLPGVSHFAHLQNPALFNAAMTEFLDGIGW